MIEPLEESLVRLLLEGIKYDRKGVDCGGSHFQSDSTIYGVIQSLVSVEEYKKKGNLDLYEEIFEKPFLLATGEFYREEAAKLLGEGSISQYMERVITKIEAEDVRSRKFLYPSSYQKVTGECEQEVPVPKLLPEGDRGVRAADGGRPPGLPSLRVQAHGGRGAR